MMKTVDSAVLHENIMRQIINRGLKFLLCPKNITALLMPLSARAMARQTLNLSAATARISLPCPRESPISLSTSFLKARNSMLLPDMLKRALRQTLTPRLIKHAIFFSAPTDLRTACAFCLISLHTLILQRKPWKRTGHYRAGNHNVLRCARLDEHI